MSNKKITGGQELYPQHICFEENVYIHYAHVAEAFGLSYSVHETNNTLVQTPKEGTIYVLNEFEDNPIMEVLEANPNIWILGPPAVQQMALNPSFRLRSKPTYCTSMYGFCFYINCPNDVPLMKRMVKLIKWMCGSFAKSPNSNVTHMISTTTLSKGYHYCFTFNVPIMTPEWVEFCWGNRHTPIFQDNSNSEDYKLKAFTGLSISFKGFDSSTYNYFKLLTEENGGVVVSMDTPSCTHLVIDSQIVTHINIEDIPPQIPFVVLGEWFTSSLEHKQRDYEKLYKCFNAEAIKNARWGIPKHVKGEAKNRTSNEMTDQYQPYKNDSIIQNNEDISERQDKKRKFAFEELCKTEKNYVKCLTKLMVTKCCSLKCSEKQEAILTKTDIKIIFGNIEKILDIHKAIFKKLDKMLSNWRNDVLIGDIFIDAAGEMQREYVLFSNNMEDSVNALQRIEQENHKFRDLLKYLGDDREHQKDLFIRPIQRLCQITLILCEIKKNTRDSNPDKQLLTDAIETIRKILRNMNEDQAKRKELEELFHIYNRIKNCPPDLLTSHRKFIIRFMAKEVSERTQFFRPNLVLFLFNDMLMVTKSTKPGGLFKTWTSKNKLYFVATLSLSVVSHVLRFEETEKDHKIFGLSIRDLDNEKCTINHCFEYLDENEKLDDTLLLIANQLSQREEVTKTAKDYILTFKNMSKINIASLTSNNAISCSKNLLTTDETEERCGNANSKEKRSLRKSSSCGNIALLTPNNAIFS